MDNSRFEHIALLRATVGYLGERDQYAWWQSSFFAANSRAFLSPIFSRTQLVAQCAGATRAAALIHDERIGVGNVYHLFRLPEDVEQQLHRVLHSARLSSRISSVVASRDTAFAFLRGEAVSSQQHGVGPTRVGATADFRKPRSWRVTVGQYLSAFERETQIYPYFTD